MPKVDNVVIFGDSIVNFNRQIKYKIKIKAYKVEKYDLNIFPGPTSKDLLQYIERTLVDHCFGVVIICIGVTDIISKRGFPDFDQVLKNI